MGSKHTMPSMLSIMLMGILIMCPMRLVQSQLSPTFYNETCPNLESIASSTYQSLATANNVVSPSILRMSIHDCFIQGCDGSILISSTTNNVAERDYVDNDLPQQAFDTVESMKQAVDASCPGVVSCADILALATRESVRFLGGPSWQVELGRRDSRISLESNAAGNIPQSDMDGDQLIALFQSKGLDAEDLAVLSGAHTIGFSKCRQFAFRLDDNDPYYSTAFANQLRGDCPGLDSTNVVAFDATPFVFDLFYYTTLQNNQGLLLTDQALFEHPLTRGYVNQFASSQGDFFQAFTNSIVRMFRIGVLTGNEGEIRNICSQINSS